MPIAAAEPSLLNPLDWLKAKLQDFFTLPARIAALRARGEKLATIAEQRARPELASQVRQATAALGTTQSMHAAVQQKISGLFAELGKLGVRMPGMSGYDAAASELRGPPLWVRRLPGTRTHRGRARYLVRRRGLGGYDAGASELGIIPLAVLALAGAVAVAIYGVFRHYNNQEKVIADVEKGLLSADEAKKLLGGLSFDVGGALTPLVWIGGAVALFFLWPKLRRAFG